jgi:N-acetylmuramoyl-L-alanine amidase
MSKVFLSAGHGGKDPGAVANGLLEKNINLDILLSCKSELERHGVTVVCSRVKDKNDAVGEEVKEANASGADIAVSFHTNAGGGDGSEAFYHTSSADGKRLAELGEKYVKALGQNSRGVKSGNKLAFVKNTKMVAVLFECAFIDNNTDVKIIDSANERKAFGVAYAKAILEYFGIDYKAESVTISRSFRVKITDKVSYRSGPGVSYTAEGNVIGGVFTIVATSGSWGKLKSGVGWIDLSSPRVRKL